MLVRASSAVSTAAAVGSLKQQDGFHSKFAGEKLNVSLAAKMNQGRCAVHHSAYNVKAMATKLSTSSLNGVIFEPFTEVQDQLTQISQAYSESLARQRFSDPCEAALNEQINVEYNVSYVYHALFAYFDRDNVALPGFAKYFREASDEERNHAEMLMKYQNTRGGKVVLQSILMPLMEFDHPHKGDALYAMELALSLEKLTNEKLLNLHSVAQEANDSQMTDYIEGNFLTEQVEDDTGVQFANIIRMPQQFQYFVQYKNKVAQILGVNETNRLVAEGLMSITLGGNDYVNNYYLTPVSARAIQYTLPAYTQFIVSEYKKYLRQLYNLGGRRVLVTSTGPLGCAPGVKATRSRNGECAAELQQAASLFNSQLRSVITQLNSEVSAQVFTFADSYSMNMGLFSNPAAYGFVDTTNACCGQGRYNGIGLCTAASSLCRNRDTYLFWDNYHPSEKANRIIVDDFFQGSSSVMSPLNLRQMMKLDD